MAQLTLFFKEKPIDTFLLDEEPVTIGRDNKNTFIIDSLAIAPEQLIINIEGDHYIIECCSEQFPCYLNGEVIVKTRLHHEDEIRLKKHKLIFSETTINNLGLLPINETHQVNPQIEQPESVKKLPIKKRSHHSFTANLQMINGSHIGLVIPITRAVTEIPLGKNKSIPAIIVKRNNGYYLSRLTDSFKISIDGTELKSDQKLNGGELIKIDQYQFCYFIE